MVKEKDLSRRDFLKMAGTGAIVTGASMAGCRRNRVSAEGGALGDVPTDKMTYRTNRHTGDSVSLLGYGCMRWPLRKKPDGTDEIDQDAVNQLIDYAIAHGVNYFDTAPGYVRALSETATGIALKRHPRDKFYIATKLSTQGNAPGLRTFQGSKAMYDKSFRDLQVDYIDYYLLHFIGAGGVQTVKERFYDNGMLDFLIRERQVGRIRNLGWSFHGDVAAFDFLLDQQDKGKVKWDFAMIQMNYIDWKYATGMNTPAEYLMGELEKRNIQAVVMEPLLGGRLARVNAQGLELMKELHPHDTAAKWAFRYAGDHPNVLTVLSGMTYMEHLQDNLRSYSPMEPLTEKEKEILLEVTDIMRNPDFIQCTNCHYCMPCPYGLDIPGTFDLYNRIVSDDKLLKSSSDDNYRKLRREFLIRYDRAVPKPRQADFCNGCDKCKPPCPQRLDIPKELRRVETYVEHLKQNLEF
ncbi:MAG: aldo/keto reductase [Holophagaceae bacterium]|nr:aldo/keto reductase [Holophagaceae bacterium]